MNFTGNTYPGDCGCCGTNAPTYQQYNQVVQTCNVEEIPHYMNYHTHVVNNCVKKHINIPTYSSSFENVYLNEYVNGNPVYAAPMMNQAMYSNPMYYQTGYQGNVGVDGVNTQFVEQNPNMFNQFNPYVR